MITEQNREHIKIEKLKENIQICDEILHKSEKYERLIENSDFKAFLDDLKIVISLHEREIKFGQSLMIEAPNQSYVKMSDTGKEMIVSSKSDWMDFIIRHAVQKDTLENWLKEPRDIIEKAQKARAAIPVLKKQLSELEKENANA